ncbi:MAG: fibronectin type III domain-containing protein [Bacteroidales bacterium]|nr:fibronectin type III domain-containing protein [Bacteroidales bacterium]
MKRYLTKVLFLMAMLPCFVMAQCPTPTQVAASNVAGNTALITWTCPNAGNFDVEYKTTSASTWDTAVLGVTTHYYYLSGLTTNTAYQVRVRSNCSGSSSTWATANFRTNNCLGSGDVTVGSGTTTTYNIPVNNLYCYTYSQQIFTAAELGGTAQTITAISFQYAYSTAMTRKTSCVIYLGHTSQATFSGTANYVPLANLTQVYSGTLNCSQGWNTFTFSTPFNYNGRDNLVLAVDDNSGSYNSSTYTFNSHSASNKCIYFYHDSYNPNPSNPTSAGAYSSLYSYRNNVRFTMCNSTMPARPAPVIAVMDVTHNAIELAWAPVGTETSWIVEYSTNMANWTSAGTLTRRSHRFTRLQSNTQYFLRVGAIVPNDTIYAMVTVTTDCGLMSFPCVENFDRLSTGSNSPLSSCWTKNSDYSTGYPYVNSGSQFSSPNYLYLYNYGTSHTGVVTPKSPEPLNRLQVSFSLYKSNTSYAHDVVVGALTDPDDYSTFEPIDTAETGPTYGSYHFTIPLDKYNGSGRYIGLFACTYGSNYSYPQIDDIVIDYYATCSRATNVQTQSNSPYSAISTWQPGSNGTPEYYIVSYSPASLPNWVTDTTHSPYKVFNNLTGGETYYISITPVCAGNDTSYAIYDTVTTPMCMTVPLYIGNGNTSTVNLPMETDMYGSYAQQIFDSVDLGGPNTYSAIAFNYTGSSATLHRSNCTIYMANTHDSTFVANSNNAFIHDSVFTKVYEGSLNCTPGWNVFNLDTTFYYDGTGNLVVAVEDNGQQDDNNATFATHATTGYKSAVIGSYGQARSLIGIIPPSVYAYRNNIALYYCDTAANCAPPTVASTGVTDNTINIAWAPGLTETSWIIERGTTANGPWTYVTTTNQRNYTFNNLTASTRYYFRVGAICVNDTMYSIVTDSTDCAYITTFPYTEGFESYPRGNSLSSNIGVCWGRISNISTTVHNPYVYGVTHQGGGVQAMYFSTNSSQYAVLTTPPMGVPTNKLMVTFESYRSQSSYNCKTAVGVMTDPTDITTFVGIDTVWGTYGVWETYTVSLENYTGTGRYIALAAVQNEYTYTYIDNITIDTIPACPKPTKMVTNSITSNSAFTSWVTGTIGDGVTHHFIVEIKRSNQAAWNVVDTTSNEYFFFSNLSANTSYDVRVRAVCTCGDTSEYATSTFTTALCLVGGNVELTPSSITSYYMPLYMNYSYSYTQQLFTNAEMGGPKFIEAIELYYSSNTPMSVKDSCTIYLGHTSRSSFTSINDYVPFRDLVPVYTDSLNATTRGWIRFTFDRPFYYNGVDNLVVAIDDNSGTSQGTNCSYYCYSANNKAMYFYSNTDINPASPPTSGGLYSYRNSIKFISPCNNNAPCVAPNVRLMEHTDSSASMLWVPGSTDSVWVVLYKPRIDSIWHVADTVTDTSYVLRHLSALSTYDIRVMSLCGGDSAYAELTVRTGCGPISVYPYVEDFEAYYGTTNTTAYDANTQLPDCWNFYSSGSYSQARRNDYTERVYGGTSTTYLPNNVPKALLITASNYSSTSSTYNYQTVGARHYAVLPEFRDSLPRLTVSFKYKMSTTNTTTNYGTLYFGYVVGNDTNFTVIEKYPATTTAQTVFMDLSEDTTIHHVPGARLAFRCQAVYSSSSYIMFSLDDIEIGWAPTCIKPKDLSDAAIDSITSLLTWRDATKLSTTLGYEVTWGEFGFDPDTTIVNYTTTIDTFLSVTNLQPNSIYQFYVKALCGIDGNSVWSKPHTFRTAQIPAIMPYNCNFESTSDPTNGWTLIGPTYGNNSWIVGNAVGNNSNRSMYISNTGGILNDYSNTTPTVSWAFRDIYVPSNAGNNYNLKFDWRCDGETNRDYLAVYFGAISSVEGNSTGVLTPPANSTFVGRFYGNGSSFRRETHQLPILSDTVIRIYFAWVNDANSQGNNPPAAVDNVSVKLDCPEPNGIRVTNITPTSADVSWRVTTGAYHWLFEYRPAGINQWTSIALNDTTYSLTGLTPSMSYLVRVRCLCTSIDTSDYSDSVRFNTSCGRLTTFPFAENFDAYGTSQVAYPTCWTYVGSATRPNCSASTFSSAPASLYFNTTAGSQAIAVTPKIDVFNSYEIEVSLRVYSTSTANYLIVGLMSDSSSTQSFIGVDTVRVNTPNTWFNHTCDLSSYTGVGKFLGFKVGGSAACTFNIDDVVIDYHGGNCADPTNLNTVFGTNDMNCTWNEVANYEFQYSILGDTIWTPVEILNNANSKHVTGLTDSTCYIWRIRTICPDSAGYSHWISDTITTYALPCNPVTNIVTSQITDTTIVLKWDSDSNQNAWEIHCFDPVSGVDTIIVVYTNPCRLTNMITGLDYHFSIRSLCTSGLNGGWSDTIIATVAWCKPVRNVRIMPIGATAVNVTWDITDPEQRMWEVEYGLRGFYEGDGTGTTVITTTNSYTLTGLNMTTTYDVFVRARCNNGFYSIWTQRSRFAIAGIDTPDDENGMTLYPNPADKEVSIYVKNHAGDYSVDVVDMKGRIVKSQTFAEVGENAPMTLDISELARGTYFVKITSGEFKAVRKLIAQ